MVLIKEMGQDEAGSYNKTNSSSSHHYPTFFVNGWKKLYLSY